MAMRFTIEVDEKAIMGQIDKLITDPSTMLEVQALFANTIDPWIPYDTGNLAHNISIDPEGVTYRAHYATKNYYNTEIAHKTDKHPLATAYWDEVAMQTEKDAFIKRVEEIFNRKAGEMSE